MELTSEKSCCSAGNNQVDEQAGITQHRWEQCTGMSLSCELWEKPRRYLCLAKVKNQRNSSFLGLGAGPLISQQKPVKAVSAGVGWALERAGERS